MSSPFLTPAEWRDRLDLPPLEGEDQTFVPFSVVTALVTKTLPAWVRLLDDSDVVLNISRRLKTAGDVQGYDITPQGDFTFRHKGTERHGPVPGWRWWGTPSPYALALDLGDPVLMSPMMDTVWPSSGGLWASYRDSDRKIVPGRLDYSGIYAAYTPFPDPTSTSRLWRLLQWSVFGVVLGWGKVIEHEKGWRSEFAQPLCLVQPTLAEWDLSSVAARYGISVVSLEQAFSLGGEFL